jgi:hypothetical protein
MKMKQAIEIMDHGIDKPSGFIVRFDRVYKGFNETDHFPDVISGETPIQTEAAAWELARKFANKTFNQCINIYVMKLQPLQLTLFHQNSESDSQNEFPHTTKQLLGLGYTPVPNYETQIIKNTDPPPPPLCPFCNNNLDIRQGTEDRETLKETTEALHATTNKHFEGPNNP